MKISITPDDLANLEIRYQVPPGTSPGGQWRARFEVKGKLSDHSVIVFLPRTAETTFGNSGKDKYIFPLSRFPAM
jgi:hypothetical protein